MASAIIMKLLADAQKLVGKKQFRSRTGLTIEADFTEAFYVFNYGTKKFQKGVNQEHANSARHFYDYGNKLIEKDRKRPQERGNRPGDRETGNIRFGKGEAFGSFNSEFDNVGIATISFVDINHADNLTNYVWRSVNYGLGGTEYPAPANEHAPLGEHWLPKFFQFGKGEKFRSRSFYRRGKEIEISPFDRAFQRTRGVFKPTSRGKNSGEGRLGKGFEGHYWVEKAIEDTIDRLPRRYERIIVDSYV